MAISNTEKQQRFCKAKTEAGESKVSCWLPEDDYERLNSLMLMLGYSGQGKKQEGYAEVFSLALKELEINLSPPPHRNLVRYGLRFMDESNRQ